MKPLYPLLVRHNEEIRQKYLTNLVLSIRALCFCSSYALCARPMGQEEKITLSMDSKYG